MYNKKLYVGIKNSSKKIYVNLEIKTELREKLTTTLEKITEYHTLSMSSNNGQSIGEVSNLSDYKQLFISESDLNTIITVWENWHLNDMNTGTDKQQAFINEWKKSNKYDYTQACEALKEVGLYQDNEYKYGNAWLLKTIPGDTITNIISIFEKYNNKEHMEQKTNKATFKNFEIKASYKGTKKAEWSSDNFNNHMITVTNTETSQKITFEFWASIAHPELNKEYDILNAFYCFVSDAVGASQLFENFCSDFGYDTDSRTAEKIYRKCKKQLEKLNKIYDGDICNLVNELSEIAG